jgi:hypothetical protein
MRTAGTFSLIGLSVLVALGGCTTTPKVVAVEQSSFRLTAVGAPYETQATTNSRALLAANAYCSTQGKSLMFRHSAESGVHSWSPKQEDLTFVCMDAQDPNFMSAALKRQGGMPVVAQQ